MKRLSLGLLVLGLASVPILALGPAGSPGLAELWIADPNVDVYPGATVRIKGSGFPPAETVAIYIREDAWTKARTNVSGAFEVSAVVPSLPPDVYTIRALVGETLWATHPLNVGKLPTPTPPPPQDASIKFVTWTINGVPVPLEELQGQVLVRLAKEGVADDVGDQDRAQAAFLFGQGSSLPWSLDYTGPPARSGAPLP